MPLTDKVEKLVAYKKKTRILRNDELSSYVSHQSSPTNDQIIPKTIVISCLLNQLNNLTYNPLKKYHPIKKKT